MKLKIFAAICFLTLIFDIGCKNIKIPDIEDQKSGQSIKLTLEIVSNLLEKGDKMSWEDFQAYDSKDIGSGLYIRLYTIDDKYELSIGGGSLEMSPMYMRLSNKYTEESIDIRHDDIDKFIK